MLASSAVPQQYQNDLERAVKILRDGGCTEVYLFGSLTSGKQHQRSDIDLAVRGCPPGQFFHLLGELLFKLDYPVDLVDLDKEDPFVEFLIKKGKLQQIA